MPAEVALLRYAMPFARDTRYDSLLRLCPIIKMLPIFSLSLSIYRATVSVYIQVLLVFDFWKIFNIFSRSVIDIYVSYDMYQFVCIMNNI